MIIKSNGRSHPIEEYLSNFEVSLGHLLLIFASHSAIKQEWVGGFQVRRKVKKCTPLLGIRLTILPKIEWWGGGMDPPLPPPHFRCPSFYE